MTADLSRLRSRLEAWLDEGSAFAVVKGAAYSDCPALLREEGLVFGSLFREPRDAEIMRTGPFLVRVDKGGHLEAFLSLPDITWNAVFWLVPGARCLVPGFDGASFA